MKGKNIVLIEYLNNLDSMTLDPQLEEIITPIECEFNILVDSQI